MSGAEAVIGTIASVVAICTSARDAYKSIQDMRDLPGIFREVEPKISIIIGTLETIQEEARIATAARLEEINKVVASCQTKVEKLSLISEKLKVDDSNSLIDKYVSTVRRWGKKGRVEDLLKDLIQAMVLLATHRSVTTEREQQLSGLKQALTDLEETGQSIPDSMLEAGGTNISIAGTGTQQNQIGNNNTLNSTGGGHVFGDVSGGTFHFAPQAPENSLDRQCRTALRSQCTDPQDDKTRIERDKGGLMDKAFRWILGNSEYKRWRSTDEACLLWIKGDPGKGKTMLLCGIINELKTINPSACLAYFFCQAADNRINSAISVLLGLIYLLVDLCPPAIRHIRARFDDAKEMLFQGPNATYALEGILLNILQDPLLVQNSGDTHAFLIIDALDECTTDLGHLLAFLVRASSTCPRVKWIVSSRNCYTIKERLRTAEQISRLSLELNKDSVSAAVTAFVHHEVETLAARKRYDPQTRTEVEQYLSENSQGTFLWVALAIRALYDVTLPSKVHSTLRSFLPGLDSLYERAMRHLRRIQEWEICEKLLAVAAVAHRPLSISEYAAINAGTINDLQLLFKRCDSLVIIQNSTIYWVHQSAKDYLLRHPLGTLSRQKQAHRAVYEGSLQAMSRLKRDIYDLAQRYGRRAYGLSADDVRARRPTPDPLEGLDYSCMYWVHHLRDSDISEDDLGVDGHVPVFLRDKYVYWLEASSILGDVPQAVISMNLLHSIAETSADLVDTVESHAKPRPNSEFSDDQSGQNSSQDKVNILELVQDMRRFLLAFKTPLELCPLQVYASGITMSPFGSITKKLFWGDRPSWFKIETPLKSHWDGCLQTLEGHSGSIHAIVFSKDGRQLSSASSDQTVRVWDVATGRELHKFFEYARSITFSPDGSKLAVGFYRSHHNTIDIWDLATGNKFKTFFRDEEFANATSAFSFSEDGLNFISGYSDGEIIVWDVESNKIVKKFGKGGVQNSMVSPDGRLVAMAENSRLNIWEIATETVVHRFTTVTLSPAKVALAFSPDSRQLAALQGGRRIRLYNLETGQEREIDGSVGAPREAASEASRVWFSPSGRFLAVSASPAIFFLDLSPQQKHTIPCPIIDTSYTAPTQSGQFSPGGQHIAAASSEGSIRLWEIAARGRQAHPPFSRLKQVSFALESSRLATLSTYQVHSISKHAAIWDVSIWGLSPFRKLMAIPGHSGQPNGAIALSPDGNQLAVTWESYSMNGRTINIEIWDVGGETPTLRHRTKRPQVCARPDYATMSFSPDGGQLVLVFPDLVHLGRARSRGRSRMLIVTMGTGKEQWVTFYRMDCVVIGFSPCSTCVVTTSKYPGLSATTEVRVSGTNTRTGETIFNANLEVERLRLPGPEPTGYYMVPDRLEKLPAKISSRSYGVNEDMSWITLEGERLVWLPSEYRVMRPDMHMSDENFRFPAVASSAQHTVFYSLSGYLSVFQFFDPDMDAGAELRADKATTACVPLIPPGPYAGEEPEFINISEVQHATNKGITIASHTFGCFLGGLGCFSASLSLNPLDLLLMTSWLGFAIAIEGEALKTWALKQSQHLVVLERNYPPDDNGWVVGREQFVIRRRRFVRGHIIKKMGNGVMLGAWSARAFSQGDFETLGQLLWAAGPSGAPSACLSCIVWVYETPVTIRIAIVIVLLIRVLPHWKSST
ncbi:hypothetical protein RB597_002619 [Gaeumannomyces tritici]